MRYVKIVMSNGYCGCDEEEYVEFSENTSDTEIDDYAKDSFLNYGFYEPDSRFVDFDDENWEEAVEEYQDGCSFSWEEITKEEYMEMME